MSLRSLGGPRPARVVTAPDGAPRMVTLADGRTRVVAAIRDDWHVQDRWWTDTPVDRRYFEVVLDPGRVVVLYRDGTDGSWHTHG